MISWLLQWTLVIELYAIVATLNTVLAQAILVSKLYGVESMTKTNELKPLKRVE